MDTLENVVAKKGSRLYGYIWDVQVGWAMHFKALEAMQRYAGTFDPEKSPKQMSVFSRRAESLIVMPYEGVFQSAVQMEPPDEVWFRIRSGFPHPEPDKPSKYGEGTSIGTGGPVWAIMDATFAIFAERCNDWLKTSGNTDTQRWPPVSNFARVVRNAIVHGGTINIDSPRAPTVTWRGLSYDHTKKGTNIFPDLAHGDFILLAMDLNEEMTSLGAPSPLP